MPRSDVYCMDCLEAIKKLPDNAFDLAVVDPPYGDALEHTHTHNCDATAETDGTSTAWNRFGQRFDRYKTNICQAGGGITARSIPHWWNVG